MRPDQWARVEELFAAALERPVGDRSRFVIEAAGGDAEVVAEVEALLAADASPGTPFDRDRLAALEAEVGAGRDPVGQSLGPYRLDQEIGSGGMGTVYLAHRDDEEFDRRVAIKVVSQGLGSADVLQRFRAERQILASLDHPNIARMLEGGTTADGRPYLVMEHIEGRSIEQHCDDLRLPVRRRVELVRTVCGAVHAAHQSMVVHRDLKPSNIMITSRGEPKLLDFGIAKLLDPVSWAVDSGLQSLRAMTPAFASPEQIHGDPITTASDVFSLGAVLHHLLVGVPPDRTRVKTGTVKVSAAIHPSRVAEVAGLRATTPARLRRDLSGDLDVIVATCLAFDPARRYHSIAHLADDLDRHLRRDAVSVRPGRLYRSGRFLRRHWQGATAVVVLVATLLSAVVATRRQARIAELEGARAQRHLAEVRELATTFLFDFHDAVADLPGSTSARELVVSTALEYLELLAEEDPNPTLLHELATAWERVGDAQGNPFQANLGRSEEALASYRRALELRRRLADHRPEARRELAGTHDRIGDIQFDRGRLETALASYGEALEIRRRALADQPLDVELRRGVASNHVDIGDIERALGRGAAASESYRQARGMFESLATVRPDDDAIARGLSVVCSKLADVARDDGDLDGARVLYERSHGIREGIVARSPNSASARRDLSYSLVRLADCHGASGDHERAIELYRRALVIDRELAGADPANRRAQRDLSISCQRLAEVEAEHGDPGAALTAIAEALELRGRLVEEEPSRPVAWSDLASVQVSAAEINLALASSHQGASLVEARSLFWAAIGSLAELDRRTGKSSAPTVAAIETRVALCEEGLRARR